MNRISIRIQLVPMATPAFFDQIELPIRFMYVFNQMVFHVAVSADRRFDISEIKKFVSMNAHGVLVIFLLVAS